jgi:hypothetical protein
LDSEQRGIEAQRYLDSELFKSYLKGAEQAILEEIANCPMRDDEGRRLLQMHFKFIRGIESSLRGFAQSGRYETGKKESGIRRLTRKLG